MTSIGKNSNSLYNKLSTPDPQKAETTEAGSKTDAKTDPKTAPQTDAAKTGSKTPTDGFDTPAANPPLQMTPKAIRQQNKALNGFNKTFNSMFNPSARELAAGKKAADPTQLTEAQTDKLLGATKDVLMDMPIAALSPKMGAKLKDYLESKGMDVKDFEGKSLKDIGKYGGEFAKQYVDTLRGDSPGVFYGIAATAATAIGVLGYTSGSDAIKKLGIKPQYKAKFFNKSLEVRAEASWGAKFKDPGLDLKTSYKFENGSRLSSSIGTKVVDGNRFTDFSLAGSGRISNNWTGSASANYNTDNDYSLKGNLNYKNGDWSGQVGSAYDSNNGFSATAGAQYNPTKNFSLNFAASQSEKGGSRAFIGVGWTF